MPAYCEIRIKGHLDPGWARWFGGMTLVPQENNETLITGRLPDQAALHGLLERIRDLNLPLISVNLCDSFSQGSDANTGDES